MTLEENIAKTEQKNKTEKTETQKQERNVIQEEIRVLPRFL